MKNYNIDWAIFQEPGEENSGQQQLKISKFIN